MRLIDADKLEYYARWEVDEAPTVDAVPVNWIEDYLEKIHDDLDCARQDNDEEAMKRIFWKYETIRWMVADWRHDEKTR